MNQVPQGVRAQWQEILAKIRAGIESRLGSVVVSAENQPGGFSPGMAARIQTADGGRAFVKAVGPELNPDSPGTYRREAQISAALPASAAVSRLLWTYEDTDSGWIVLAFEEIDGVMPAQPWRPEELHRVVEALVELSAALTPSPIESGSASEIFATSLHGWEQLRVDPPPGLDDWSVQHLDAIASLEAMAPAAAAGTTLLHLDLRADNLLLTSDRVVVVDWPNAAAGAPWIDLLGFAPSAALQGGPHPEDLLMRHPAACDADAKAVTSVVAALAGYFTHQALQPPPPGIPTVRAFQAAQGEVAREWLARRMGLPLP